MSLDKTLLEILACPSCKSPVQEQGEWLLCQNQKCGLQYPVRNDIPIMLIDEARQPAK